MPTHAAYPQEADLLQWFLSTSLITLPPDDATNLIDLQGACDYAAEQWQFLTGYEPFLVGAHDAETTWFFDGDGSRTLDLEGGFVSISDVSLNGTTRALNTDYRPYPINAAVAGKPITYLKWGGFWRPFPAWYGQRQPVSVTGLRGYCTALPQVAWEGIIALAVLDLLGNVEFLKFQGIKSWTVGSDVESYDTQAMARLGAILQNTADRAVRRFKRNKMS